MVTLLLDRTQLEVALSPIERAAAFQRDNVRVPRESIAKVQLTDDPWTWLRGVPGPGTHLPGFLAAGSFKSASGVDFVLIRRRKPGAVIDLTGADAPFQRLILSTRHALALTQALRLEASNEPAEVSEIVATGAIPVQPEGSRDGAQETRHGRKRPVIRPKPA